MKNIRIVSILGLAVLLLAAGCVTRKKKGDKVGWFKQNYHNTTSKYNYWFNADELFNLTVDKQADGYVDNYNQLLELYPYAAADPQSAKGDFDNVIKKSSMAISLHRVSEWTDDCYTLIGASQFLKRDFETAENTFKYIRDEYDPKKKMKTKLKSSKKKKTSVKDSKKKSSSKKKKSSSKKKKKKKSSSKKKKSSSKSKSKSSDKSKTTTGASKDTKTPAPTPAPDTKPKEEEPELVVTGANPYKKNALKRTAAFPEAMVWYSRTLIEREKYDEAEFLIRDLNEDPWFPQSVKKDLSIAETYLWIKQKKYDKAVEPLEKAITLTRKKKDRARLAFILAQLYDRSNQQDKAYAALETVLRSNPVYEMEFNARLRQIQAGWSTGKINSADANRSLERLLRDDKNLDYRDQIYYVLADIALKDGQKKEGIAYLKQSLVYNKGNTAQRGESYLKLADLYFEAEDYVPAKNYYDSTLNALSNTDERYKRVSDYASNLKDIARLIQVVADNDSIIRVYNMSEAERLELAKKIKKDREAAEAAAAKAEAAKAAAAASGGSKAPGPLAGAPSSSFYFYNEAFVKKGKKDFSKVWGTRKLEDNWRRSVRPSVAGEGDVAASDSTKGDVSDADLKDFFQGIPKNDAELTVIHAATYEAMFNLGKLYRDKIENNRRCSGTLEDMQARYPDTARYEKETWYYCYLAFTDLSNADKAKFYFDKLVGKYPNSPYARALTDPNFLNSTKERERDLNQYYEQTYSMFQKGDYKTAFDRCTDAPKKYGSTNPLMPKFTLLSALCVGNLQGNDAYCKALAEVIARYPDAPEATRAKEIARLLSCKGFEVEEKKVEDKAPIDEAFTLEDDKLHYIMVAISGGDDVRLDDIKSSVSDYNRENHKLESLRISNIFLGTDTNTPIIVIRKFDNKSQAMRYFNEIKGRKEFLGESAKKTYNKEVFAITQENYRRVLKNKTLDGYREFFEENYLK